MFLTSTHTKLTCQKSQAKRSQTIPLTFKTFIIIALPTIPTIIFLIMLSLLSLIILISQLKTVMSCHKTLPCLRALYLALILTPTLLFIRSMLTLMRKNFFVLFFRVRNQGIKKNSSTKRASSIHEEKKLVPNESNKPIITASGGVNIEKVIKYSI